MEADLKSLSDSQDHTSKFESPPDD